MKRALLLVGDGPELPSFPGGPLPSVCVSVDVDFDRDAKKWKATDDVGNVVHDDWQIVAILRCFELRLAMVREVERRLAAGAGPLTAAMDNVLAWRLGEATVAAAKASAGDAIDRGLALLHELHARGFDVVPR